MMMQLACSCCTQVKAVTIKGIDKTDGTTIWEYGPGAFWRHHYGLDAISGVVPDTEATLNQYAVGASSYPKFADCGNRNAGTLAANAVEAIQLVKLDSLDGTTVESATLQGFFCSDVRPESFALMLGQSITNAAALSGGDYVIVGERLPFIEFIDFTSNGATKEYILHAHGMIGGNVYLKTRTSSETITIPFNSTAGEVETLFEATSDCVSATATGGPWPLKAITIEVEWSVSGGDVAGISVTPSQSAVGGGTDFDLVEVYNSGDNSWTSYLTVNTVSVNSEWTFQFDGSGGLGASSTFVYTSTTDDTYAFVAALKVAFAAYQAAHSGEANWGQVVLIEDNDANQLYVEYSNDARFLTVTADIGEGITDERRPGSCAASYSTATGEMNSSVGYRFGFSADRTPSKMFTEEDELPTVTGLNVLGISSIGSGPDDSVVITPLQRGAGDSVKASVVECWSIDGADWSFNWQVYCNATMTAPEVIAVENGVACIPIRPKRFDDIRDRTAATIAISDATTTEVMTTYSSLSNGRGSTTFIDGSSSTFLSWGYDIPYQGYQTNNTFRINAGGSDTWVNESYLKIGATAFGCDGASVFGLSHPATERFRYDPWPEMSSFFLVGYFATSNQRSNEPQQFRFRFVNMPGTNYTAWLDWDSSSADIKTALEALLGAGNVDVDVFPEYHDTVENSPDVLIEKAHLWIQYHTDFASTPGSPYIPNSWLSTNPFGNVIDVQNVTKFTDPIGIAAYSTSNASLIWSRPWGTKGATTISQPLYAWLQGDLVYAYGNIVDSEL